MKNYSRIKSVLDDALQFYADKGGKFTKGGERVKNGKHIFMHQTKFPCVKQPLGSVKEAFYALHHLKGIVRDLRIRALPANLRPWAEKFAAINDADLMEDFWRIQTQIAQVLHEYVDSTGEVMHCDVALTNREIEGRLDRQRDTRTFMTREGVRLFPTRTT
jgi:hypothetical protein